MSGDPTPAHAGSAAVHDGARRRPTTGLSVTPVQGALPRVRSEVGGAALAAWSVPALSFRSDCGDRVL